MSAKPSLLLLHGALGSAAQFDRLIPTLSDTFTCHTFDFDGHGRNPSLVNPSSFRIENFAQDTLDWLDKQKIATMDIFGYSMGGYLAVWLAHQQPERVGSIMTLGTKYLWAQESAAKEMQAMNPDTIEEKVPHFARLLEARHTMPWQMVLRNTRQMIEELGENNLLTEDVLAQIDHPIRIAVGDRDNTVSVEEAAKVAHALPHGELEIFPATPHPLDKVSPDRLIRSLEEFLR